MEDIVKCFYESSTIREICIKLYGKYSGHQHRIIVQRLKELKLDISELKERYRLSKIIPRIEKSCPVCNNKFFIKSSETKVTCSYGCSNTYFNGISRNLNISNYRTIAFRTYKKECIICNESNIVEVHHYDENHDNDDPLNLIPLCPTHHQYYHSKYKYLVIDKIEEFHNELISGVEQW